MTILSPTMKAVGIDSFVSWVDYSARERDQMKQAVALFTEGVDTFDELGMGTIRDVIAGALFPGTSTIQTRLRYFLFVPWMYRELEGKTSVTSANVAKNADNHERRLIDPLRHANDNAGAFGKTSGKAVLRLPSSVYWAGLSRWGIFQSDASLDEYHRSWDSTANRRRSTLKTEDAGIAPTRLSAWHPDLPVFGGAWENVTFALTRGEAEFLRDRILSSCADSLLAYATQTALAFKANYVWEAFANLPELLTEQVAIAERFSLLMHGAAVMYNLALTEHSEHQAHVDRRAGYRDQFLKWQSEAAAAGVDRWDLEILRRFVEAKGKPANPKTFAFVQTWQGLVRNKGRNLVDEPLARQLMRDREGWLKKTRSRFTNARALEMWGGRSGANRLDFRWGTTQSLLKDLHDGLASENG